MNPTDHSAKLDATPSAKLDATVFVIDDDEAMRTGIEFLMRSAGLPVQTFESGQAFLDYYQPTMAGCMLLDVRMAGMDGLDLLEHLRRQRIHLPVIMVTAYGDVPMAVRAMQAGACDFIEKPFDATVLLDRVHKALRHEMANRADEEQRRQLRQRLASLTPREREVMELVVSGLLNKQIAGQLGISIKTVETHRACIMQKTQAGSLAELVRIRLTVGEK